MTLHDFIQQEQQNVGKTPPMLLQLRRIAIRQFPGKQIALYSNPQLKIQLAIPYDTGSGVLHASNMVPVAVHENLTPVHAIEAKKKQEFETHLANIAKNVGVEVGVKKHERNAARYAKLLARTKPTDLGEAIMPIGKHYPVHINNPKSPYHAKFGYVVGHEKETGRLHVAVHGVEKPITFEKHHVVNESYNDELETDDIVQTMQDNYEELMNKTDPDELDDAILNWLNDELEEHGEFDKMPEDVIRDIYDDYCSLTGEEKPEDVEEATKPTPSIHRDVVWGLKVNHQHPVNSFMDWHDRVEKKGGTETKFKVHNAGNSTSAYRMGKHLGTYHHNKKSGFVNEDTLIESPMHRLNSITRQGEEQDVVFHDGRSARVHPKMAKVVKSLLDKVNSHNKVKLANLINSSPEGLDQVTQFAHSTITK